MAEQATFDKWLEQVNTWCWTLASCSVHDLADCRFMDWYEGNVGPKTAAKRALRNSGWR